MEDATLHIEPTRKRRRRTVLTILLALLFLGAAAGAWRHWSNLPVDRLEVQGVRYASRKEILARSGLRPGMRMGDIDVTAATIRIRQDEWIRDADIRRHLNGMVTISVSERVPVTLVLGRNGQPLRYLDAHAHPLPVTEVPVFDVPLVSGVSLPTARLRPVSSTVVRELTAALGRTNEATDRLLSDFEIRDKSDVWLRTIPAPDGKPLVVRLGRSGFDEKLARLNAFWHQAVLTRPEMSYELVDLRFDGQVVTKETNRADSTSGGGTIRPVTLDAQPTQYTIR